MNQIRDFIAFHKYVDANGKPIKDVSKAGLLDKLEAAIEAAAAA